MKRLKPMLVVLALIVSSSSLADTSTLHVTGTDVLIDAVILRPLGAFSCWGSLPMKNMRPVGEDVNTVYCGSV